MVAQASRTRSWGRIALIAVLAVSLLGNAVSLGAAVRFRTIRAELLGPSAEAALFPRALRKEFHDALADNSDQLIPMLHALVRTRAQIVAAADIRPFDRAAVAAEMEVFNTQAAALLAQAQNVLLDRLEEVATRP
jgi:hypothetical protein